MIKNLFKAFKLASNAIKNFKSPQNAFKALKSPKRPTREQVDAVQAREVAEASCGGADAVGDYRLCAAPTVSRA